MGILLGILKVIGIILLCILGLILLLVLLLLFCPFTYNISAEGSLKDFSVTAKLGWLACLIRPSIIYKDKTVKMKVRVFGIPFNLGDKNEQTQNQIDNETDIQYNNEVTSESVIEESSVGSEDSSDDVFDDEFDDEFEDIEPFNFNDDINYKRKPTLFQKIQQKLDKPKEKKPKVKLTKEEKAKAKQEKKEKAKKAREEKIASIKAKLGKVKEVIETLQKQETKDAIALVKDVVYKCVKHIAPNRFKGHIEFGMEDPCTTGQILAAAAMVYPAFKGNLGIVPIFETDETQFEGNANVKGHVFMIFFVAQAIRILKNKTIMGLIKKAKK